MATYKSVDQTSKDLVNGILVKATTKVCTDSGGRIITLDDQDNGTISTFVTAGYSNPTSWEGYL